MLLSIEGISICWTKNFSCCKSTNASSCLVHSKIYQFIFGWTIFKVDTSKFYSFLVVFNTFSPTYAYVFFRVCRHHSTKSAKWGHLIPFAPLSASGRQLPPLLPPPTGSATYASTLFCWWWIPVNKPISWTFVYFHTNRFTFEII